MIGPGARKAEDTSIANVYGQWGNIMHDGQRILQLTASHDTGHGTGEEFWRKNFRIAKRIVQQNSLSHTTPLGTETPHATRDTVTHTQCDRSHGQEKGRTCTCCACIL